MRLVGLFAAAGLFATALGQPALAQCNLGNGIKHVVYLQFDNVIGPNSPQHQENIDNHNKAVADFEGIIVHCAKGSSLCAKNSAPDILKDEPGGYNGFTALYGNVNVQPQISPGGPVKDLDG